MRDATGARFLGRGRTTRDPVALESRGPLSGTTGAVLDPIFALRTRVRLEPRQSASVAFTTLVATSPERAFELADRYHHPRAAQRALDLAWTSAQVELRELSISAGDAGVFQELAGHLFFANPSLRAPSGGAAPEPRLPADALDARGLGRLAHPARDHRLGRGAAHPAAAARRPITTGGGGG